jgi:hypothetical protein
VSHTPEVRLRDAEVGHVIEMTLVDESLATPQNPYVDGLVGPRACQIIDAANGRADYTTVSNDFPAGRYAAQVEVDQPARDTRFRRFLLIVEPAVAP